MGLEAWGMPPPLPESGREGGREREVGVKDAPLREVPDASSPISQPPGGEG